MKFEGVYKQKEHVKIENLNIDIEKGIITSIECTNDVSDTLVNLILGRDIPAKGRIIINGHESDTFFKKNPQSIGIVLENEGHYEKLMVKDVIKFFQKVFDTEVNSEEVLLKTALMDVKLKKVKELTYSQRKRLSLAREILKDPEIMIIQEPILNMDMTSAAVVVDTLEYLKGKGVSILITSLSLKSTIILGDKSYRLDEDGLKELQDHIESEENLEKEDENIKESADEDKINCEKPIYKVKKIPAKVEDKILLFNPTDIDYIESEKGMCILNIRGEKFPCNLSLAELENRLSTFGFFRCHRSYLVNLQQVREIVTWTRNSYTLSLDDKEKSSVPLSKGRIEELKEILKI